MSSLYVAQGALQIPATGSFLPRMIGCQEFPIRIQLSHVLYERAIIWLENFKYRGTPPVLSSVILANYLHFTFQNGFLVSFFFFWLTRPSLPPSSSVPRLPVFQLVSTNAAGVAHPLPAELGPLPLYRLDDGSYSVLGLPLNYLTLEAQANGSRDNALAYNPVNVSAALTLPRDKVFCGSFKCSGNRFAHPSTVLCSLRRLTWRRGPHSCSPRAYTCNAPACTRLTPFKTKQALNRHYEAIHLAQRIDCPVPGCENIGERGIKRYDNLVAHMKNRHGVSAAGGSHRN